MYPTGSNTLPRGFRYHAPSTPEPLLEELKQPSPPRQRLKVRRRNVSNIQGPTDHFLASVAAADTPIPTIEIGQPQASEDAEMRDRDETMIDTTGLVAPNFYEYDFASPSPPRTPLPTLSLLTGPAKRPNWTMGTPSPAEDYFTRPSSSMSSRSDFSDDSLYSGSRGTRPSEDGSCTSPESEAGDPFVFPITKNKGKAIVQEPVEEGTAPVNRNLRSKTRKNARWTKAQNEHLWSIYLTYLQDPTVTPFRVGASCVPPEGVCHRVAREARRSWKGPRTMTGKSRLSDASEKSGSITPTAGEPKSYGQWPHSSSATRSQLRNLCRRKDSVSTARHFQTRSPTPFSKPYGRSRLRTPEPAFSTMDMAFSLATSAAETMKPDHPLARLCDLDGAADTLTRDSPFPAVETFHPPHVSKPRGFSISMDDMPRVRLGSPFTARTYGPSSSKPFDTRPSPPRLLSDTTGRHLRSPLRFKPHGLSSKRRARTELNDDLSPNGAIVRPRILNEQLFGTPFTQRRVRSRGFSLGDEASRTHVPGLFEHSTAELFPPRQPELAECSAQPQPALLPPPAFEPRRLRSPFEGEGKGVSNTFPRRLFQNGLAKGGFATMHQAGHQTRRSIESFDFGEGPSLRSRLEGLEKKLKMIREKEAREKRGE